MQVADTNEYVPNDLYVNNNITSTFQQTVM